MKSLRSTATITATLLCFWGCPFAKSAPTYDATGFHTYIGYDPSAPPSGYGAGMSFYTAVWSLCDGPIDFQVGLASAWLKPNNTDTELPLAPVGTYARDNWPERGPSWRDVFQNLEGGVGYWWNNHFKYGQPKFSMNATSQCYDFEIASPGWSFFQSSAVLPDNRLGIAQLSNRILVPPDGMPFSGTPNGQFLGYSYMALPFTDPSVTPYPTGDQSWTCFLSTSNFKGSIAFYIPETWSKISSIFNYPFIQGRTLDAKTAIAGSGAMEFGMAPTLSSVDSKGVTYTKIAKFQYPINDLSQAALVQDVTFYSKAAIYDGFKTWRNGGAVCTGEFKVNGSYKSTLSRSTTNYKIGGESIVGMDSLFKTTIYPDNSWGLEWYNNSITPKGIIPQYYKKVGNTRIPVSADSVPIETGLRTAEFPLKNAKGPYIAQTAPGAWTSPGPRSAPFTVKLLDGSKVTYRWYRFIDQPSFQQYAWSAAKKQALQSLVEKIHAMWPVNRDYMAPPTSGELVSLDPSLLVQPPAGMEVGYVPIVVSQESAGDITPPTPTVMSFAYPPTAITTDSIVMFATTASDASGLVSYLFENTVSGTSSGWITSPVWRETGLLPGGSYSYRVKARDNSMNETSWSSVITATPASQVPVISALSPADNSTAVVVGDNLMATFNRPISIGSGYVRIHNLTDNTESLINITDSSRVFISGNTLVIRPGSFLTSGKKYAVRIDWPAVKDTSNKTFVGVGDFTTWNFKMAVTESVGSGGTITYTDANGSYSRSSPPYSGGFVVHTFRNSGTLTTINANTVVQFLIVAGGGGGAMRHGGGGGAGGLKSGSTSLFSGVRSVTVGVGGAGANSGDDSLKAGSPGSNSEFVGVTAIGGGGGRTYYSSGNGNGGSGGGAAGLTNSPAGTGVTGQGNAGGLPGSTSSGSGGGGASLAGAAGTQNGGKGGDGVLSSISGVATYYAGGGGGGGNYLFTGGVGGLGGGGHGGDSGNNTNQAAGTAGTGGGGGGCRSYNVTAAGSAGGSGVVIVKYLQPSPKLTSNTFVDDRSGASLMVNNSVRYFVYFSEDMDASSVTAADFVNAGTAAVTINSISENSAGVFIVGVTPTSVGTLQLKIPAGAVLMSATGNPLNTNAGIVSYSTISVTSSGGTITYTDSNGLYPRSSPPYSGGYVVHTFRSSGTLTTTATTAEYLIVAGGGGGAMRHGGGGGAGGLKAGVTSLVSGVRNVTVGAGGAGANSADDLLKAGSPGSNSEFVGVTVVGGGGGRTYYSSGNGNGGSGGGAAGLVSSPAGTGVTGQGNAGGSLGSTSSGSGGGGASLAGTAGTQNGGKGGDGVLSSISGVAAYYAGGGGGGGNYLFTGGMGGLGGGGHGGDNGNNTNQAAGTAGTGGGGGGCRSYNLTSVGSNGGSGIIIVRYRMPAFNTMSMELTSN